MPKQPAYFDSQASAAVALKIDIDELREAKREGCPAFRSGRVYRRQLVEWLAKRRKRRRSIENDWLEPPGGGGWSNRREVLFNLREFVCEAYEEGVLTFRQFQKVVCGTALLITKLGRL